MNKSENKDDENHQKLWNLSKVANRINFLAMTERPFYVKRAVARIALNILYEEMRKIK